MLLEVTLKELHGDRRVVGWLPFLLLGLLRILHDEEGVLVDQVVREVHYGVQGVHLLVGYRGQHGFLEVVP